MYADKSTRTPDRERAKAVAARFIASLREDLSSGTMQTVIERNRTPAYQGGCCATHDFCDANVVMLDAFEEATGEAFLFDDGPESEEQHALWSAAWDLAVKAEFDADRL